MVNFIQKMKGNSFLTIKCQYMSLNAEWSRLYGKGTDMYFRVQC